MKSQTSVISQATIAFEVVALVCSTVAALFAANTLEGESSRGADSVGMRVTTTKEVDGFVIGVADSHSKNTTSPSDELIFLPWTTKRPVWIAVPAKPEYAYRVELLDTNGVAVPKTEAGKEAGSKFYEFGPRNNEIEVKHLHAERIPDMTAAPLLFRPSDLFQIEKRGAYTLRIQFQILTFPQTGPKRGDYTNHLIRFPPLDYVLVKP
jgi:hypothetical protein